MLQIVEQTEEEKMAMYMKFPKKKLIEMFIECNKFIDLHMKLELYKKVSKCQEK